MVDEGAWCALLSHLQQEVVQRCTHRKCCQGLREVLVAPVGDEVVRLDLLPAGAGELGLEPAGCEKERWCSSRRPAGLTSQRPESSLAARSKCETLATLMTSGAPVCLFAMSASAVSSSPGRARRSITPRAVMAASWRPARTSSRRSGRTISLRSTSAVENPCLAISSRPPGCRLRGTRGRAPRMKRRQRQSRIRGRGALPRAGRGRREAGRRGRERSRPRGRVCWACSWTYRFGSCAATFRGRSRTLGSCSWARPHSKRSTA